MILDSLVLRPGDCTLNYEFFCSPIFGCVPITVDLRNITATLLGPAGASIVGDQVGWGAEWRLVGDYTIDSILFSSTGVIDVTTPVGFSGRISVGDGGWRLDQMLLGTIESDVPADGCPTGSRSAFGPTSDSAVRHSAATTIRRRRPRAVPAAIATSRGAGLRRRRLLRVRLRVDPACCDVGDEGATIAVASCVIPPANDQCDQARDLELGRFPFTSVNADTDGGPLATACVDEATGGAFSATSGSGTPP